MIEDLLVKQRELMEKVPHGVRGSALAKMEASIKIIDALLRFLNACGHKPWRPTPLSPTIQQRLLKELQKKVGVLEYIHLTGLGSDKDFSHLTEYSRMLVSSFGIIEETTEYLQSVNKGDRQNQLEEITDILFFYLEQVILSKFSWAEIEKEYVRKHAVNLERYRRAKEGDYSWNHREKGL